MRRREGRKDVQSGAEEEINDSNSPTINSTNFPSLNSTLRTEQPEFDGAPRERSRATQKVEDDLMEMSRIG